MIIPVIRRGWFFPLLQVGEVHDNLYVSTVPFIDVDHTLTL